MLTYVLFLKVLIHAICPLGIELAFLAGLLLSKL